MNPTNKFVLVEDVVREIEFQKNQMKDYMQSWHIDEEIIDMATHYFDIAIHGVEDHLEHYER